jgi:ribosome-binding ATPase
MEAGIIGLPFVGKTTLFNALTALGVKGAGDATRPNVGMVKIPDPRLDLIGQFVKTRKVVPATMQLVDVAGLVAGASEGKGTGNKFLGHLRNVDALIHVVRCFDDDDLPHVNDAIDPVRDAEEVETELAIADLEVAENALRNAERKARTGDKEAKLRAALMQRCVDALGTGTPVSRVTFTDEEHRAIRSFAMLTAKPVLYVANIGEGDIGEDNAYVTALRVYAAQRGSEVVAVCAKLEAELAELDEAERGEMLQGLGLTEPALNVLARAAYHVLGLQSFFTAGDKENRAWTIPIGAKAPEAAGAIHSDLQRGFIRVEVFSVDDLAQHKSEAAIKAAGKLRVEGKEYVIQDGDVCHFLFNV